MHRAILLLLLPLLARPSFAATRTYDPIQMLCLVNRERAKGGIQPLGLSKELTVAAEYHSQDQATRHLMTHDDSRGLTLGQRIDEAHYVGWTTVGENVAYGYDSEATCLTAWMNSPGHRANILNPAFTHLGSAVRYGSGDNTPYYTQDFAGDGKTHNYPECPQSGDVGGDDAGRVTAAHFTPTNYDDNTPVRDAIPQGFPGRYSNNQQYTNSDPSYGDYDTNGPVQDYGASSPDNYDNFSNSDPNGNNYDPTNVANAGDYDNTPVDDFSNYDGAPTNAHYDNTPMDGNYDNTPRDAHYDNTPMDGNYDNTPMDGNYDNTPRDGNYDNTPRDGHYDNTPMDGNYDNTPMDGNYDNAPMDAHYDNTPRDGHYGHADDNLDPMSYPADNLNYAPDDFGSNVDNYDQGPYDTPGSAMDDYHNVRPNYDNVHDDNYGHYDNVHDDNYGNYDTLGVDDTHLVRPKDCPTKVHDVRMERDNYDDSNVNDDYDQNVAPILQPNDDYTTGPVDGSYPHDVADDVQHEKLVTDYVNTGPNDMEES